jgi:Leucine-rich repeat (LRR) protein
LSSTALPQPQLLLPAEISACTALTSLQLSCAAVPPHIWRLPLRDLTLDQTWMTAADMQRFSSLAALRSLQLCNKQDAQPERDYFSALHSLAVGPQLTCLRLDGNSLISTSPISAITQLVELDVRRNRCPS